MSQDHNVPFIYESPDGGKTIFRRRFGVHTDREQIPTEKDGRWERIQDHCRKLSAEMLEWDKEGDEKWGPPRSEDQAPKKPKPDLQPKARCFYQLHP